MIEVTGQFRIQVASSNCGKVAELRLGVHLWQQQSGRREEWIVEAVPGFDRLPACVEDAGSFSGNAQKKALHYSQYANGLVLADDSGLEVDALGGAPGVFSARFAGPTATDEENNRKLLRQLRDVATGNRTARFVCELALAQDGTLRAQFRGVAEGIILESARGSGGFGYDPLFFDREIGKTFAELTPQEKLQRSHRGKALRAMLDWLATQPPGWPDIK